MQQDTILMEMQYLAPIPYYAKLLRYKQLLIEKHEHFEKATYRNRCYIAGPNGPLRLSIPLKRGKNQHASVKDVEIAYDFNWQKQHWQSFCSVYRSSPYFEYYEDELAPYYEQKTRFLFDFSEQLMHHVCRLMNIQPAMTYTSEYNKAYSQNVLDFRSVIIPGDEPAVQDTGFVAPRYKQVFEDKVGFFPGMSIVDLLCCEGPHSMALLQVVTNR